MAICPKRNSVTFYYRGSARSLVRSPNLYRSPYRNLAGNYYLDDNSTGLDAQFHRVGINKKRFGGLGFGATFIGMFVSATGTMVGPFVAGAAETRQNHASTMAGLMAICHICKLVAFGFLGISLSAYLPLIAAMIASGILGNFAGRFFLDKMPEHWFRRTFKILMTALALRLLYVAGVEIGGF